MSQKDKESFKEYAQRWREVAAQICPPLEEKELTKIYLKTLGTFYYDRMVASAPSNFTEMVNMGVRLEEAVREGRLIKNEESASGSKKYGSGFQKKKEKDVSMVSQSQQRRRYPPQQVAAISPIINPIPAPAYLSPLLPSQQQQPQYQQRQQQSLQQTRPPYNNNNRFQRSPGFDPIPMSYAELFPALLAKGHV